MEDIEANIIYNEEDFEAEVFVQEEDINSEESATCESEPEETVVVENKTYTHRLQTSIKRKSEFLNSSENDLKRRCYEDKDTINYEILKCGTGRGGDILSSQDGYNYTVKSSCNDFVTWICNARINDLPCGAIVRQFDDGEFVCGKTHHNHPPNEAVIVNAKVSMKLKQKAWDSSYNKYNARKVVAKILEDFSEQERSLLPLFETLTRKFNRYRKDQRALENVALNVVTDDKQTDMPSLWESHNLLASEDPSDFLANESELANIFKDTTEFKILKGGGCQGGDLLVTKEGFCYHLMPSSSTFEASVWKCIVRDSIVQRKGKTKGCSIECGAKVVLKNNTLGSIIGSHQHKPDKTIPAHAIFMSMIKKRLEEEEYEEKKANILIQKVMDEMDGELKKLLPDRTTLKSQLRRYVTDSKKLMAVKQFENQNVNVPLNVSPKKVKIKKKRQIPDKNNDAAFLIHAVCDAQTGSQELIELYDDSLIGFERENNNLAEVNALLESIVDYKILSNTGMSPDELIVTNKGYLFGRSSSSLILTEWKCLCVSSHGCEVVVYEYVEKFEPVVPAHHNHSPNLTLLLKILLIKKLREKCENPELKEMSPKEIISMYFAKETEHDIFSPLPHRFILYGIVERFKKKVKFKELKEVDQGEKEIYRPDDLDLEDFDSDTNTIPKNLPFEAFYRKDIKPEGEKNDTFRDDLIDNSLNIWQSDYQNVLDISETLSFINSTPIDYQNLKSIKGTAILSSSDGHLYTPGRSSKFYKRWICLKVVKKRCPAVVLQLHDIYDEGLTPHNHPSSIKTVIKYKAINIIIQCLKYDKNVTPKKIYSEIFRQTSQIYHRFIISYADLKAYIMKFKNMNDLAIFTTDSSINVLRYDESGDESTAKDREILTVKTDDLYEIMKSPSGKQVLILNSEYIFKKKKSDPNSKIWSCVIWSKEGERCPVIIKHNQDIYETSDINHNHGTCKKGVIHIKFLFRVEEIVSTSHHLTKDQIVRKIFKEFSIQDQKYLPSIKEMYDTVENCIMNAEPIPEMPELKIEPEDFEFPTDNIFWTDDFEPTPNNIEADQFSINSLDLGCNEENIIEPLEANYEFVKTLKGKDLLLCNLGYIYHFKIKCKDYNKWVCGIKKPKNKQKCNASVKQYEDFFEPGRLPHLHPPSQREIVRAKLWDKLRTSAEMVRIMSKDKLLESILSEFSDHHVKYFPSKRNLKRTLNRYITQGRFLDISNTFEDSPKSTIELTVDSDDEDSTNYELDTEESFQQVNSDSEEEISADNDIEFEINIVDVNKEEIIDTEIKLPAEDMGCISNSLNNCDDDPSSFLITDDNISDDFLVSS